MLQIVIKKKKTIMKKQGISTFISVLGWILGIGGIIGSIIIGVLLDNDLSAIIIVAGILISLVNLGILLGLSQIIANTYNTYLNLFLRPEVFLNLGGRITAVRC